MQLPETLLPEEIRWRIQTYLRTPSAQVVGEVIDDWQEYKFKTVRDIIRLTRGDVETVTSVITRLEVQYTFPQYALHDARVIVWMSEGEDDDDDEDGHEDE